MQQGTGGIVIGDPKARSTSCGSYVTPTGCTCSSVVVVCGVSSTGSNTVTCPTGIYHGYSTGYVAGI